MGMIVKHNLTAMNSNRMLGLTTTSQAKATEKLSSGYKINRAADDAAGLAISEKMRKQIRGLTQASLNAQDGISAVQTADGALNEVHDMIHRLAELTVKAANGTLSETDRNAVQSEVNQLISEVDRVSTTTKFNETYLMRGNNQGEVAKLTYTVADTGLSDSFRAVTIDSTTGTAPMPAADPVVNQSTGIFSIVVNDTDATGNGALTPNNSAATQGLDTSVSATAANTTYSAKTIGPIGDGTTTPGHVLYVLVEGTEEKTKGDGKLSVSEVVRNLNDKNNPNNYPGDSTIVLQIKAFNSLDELMAAMKRDYGTDIKEVTSYVNSSGKVELKVATFADVNTAIDVSLHVGADSSADNKISMNIAMLSARGLGLNGLDVSGDNGDAATAAIDIVSDALQKVSNQRASLGAIQNRLEHTIANLDNIVENTTSAEASIRDTDMATQMVEYSNNNILAQAGQAMLAQSNQATSGVLSLLQ